MSKYQTPQNAILREIIQNYAMRDYKILELVKEIRRLLIYAKLTPPESRIYNRNQRKRRNRKKE